MQQPSAVCSPPWGAAPCRLQKDYWKDWVDVKGEYTEKGYVARDRSATAASVPALPFLVAVIVGLFAATAYVVAATS